MTWCSNVSCVAKRVPVRLTQTSPVPVPGGNIDSDVQNVAAAYLLKKSESDTLSHHNHLSAMSRTLSCRFDRIRVLRLEVLGQTLSNVAHLVIAAAQHLGVLAATRSQAQDVFRTLCVYPYCGNEVVFGHDDAIHIHGHKVDLAYEPGQVAICGQCVIGGNRNFVPRTAPSGTPVRGGCGNLPR